MTRSEVAKIQLMLLSALRLTRPIPDEELLLDAWELALGDLDYAACQRAAAVLLREEKFFPEPSTVRELVLREMTGLPDTDEAWRVVTLAIHSSASAFINPLVSALAKKAITEAVQGLGGLYNLRRSERPDRDRADFYRAWPEIRKRYLRAALEEPPAITETTGTGYPVLTSKDGTLSVTWEADEVIEDRGMGLVDYEAQAPAAVPRTIVPKQGATS